MSTFKDCCEWVRGAPRSRDYVKPKYFHLIEITSGFMAKTETSDLRQHGAAVSVKLHNIQYD